MKQLDPSAGRGFDHRLLLVDGSGRGHAFADLFVRTNPGAFVFYAPGCAAVDDERVVSVPEASLESPETVVRFAREAGVDFAFVANTNAIAHGFVDRFRDAGVPVVGPGRAAARLETSKSFAKAMFVRAGIPTPAFEFFDDYEAARAYVRAAGHETVVKADGLCGGNGAFVCDSVEDAEAALHKLMVERVFGPSGERVVVEERVFGKELSYFALLARDGHVALPVALDYPKSDDGNRGVESAGMGAISHHPLDREALRARIEQEVLAPLLEQMRSEGLVYEGVIYLGLMVDDGAPRLLEVNARMGDPEAEVTLPRIESDFAGMCSAILDGTLRGRALECNDLHLCDVVATQGPTDRGGPDEPPAPYPGWPYGAFGKGFPVSGWEGIDSPACRVFVGEAKTRADGTLVSNGGRVLHVVGRGASLDEAVAAGYANIEKIRFEGMRYRSDIGRIMPWERHGDEVAVAGSVS